MIACKTAAFFVSKEGNSDREFEDAFEFVPDGTLIAIADGATESAYSKRWAKALTSSYVSEKELTGKDRLSQIRRGQWLLGLRQQWSSFLSTKKQPWYIELKTNEGASATFLGVEITPEKRRWRALAIGDCCLFIVRHNNIMSAFPLKHSSEFNSTPSLINSVKETSNLLWQHKWGLVSDGDCLMLATDALSQWILACAEANNDQWRKLLVLPDNREFSVFVGNLRSSHNLRNDDTTCLITRITGQTQSNSPMVINELA